MACPRAISHVSCESMRRARGHWAKLAAGKPNPRKPLPEAQPSDELKWPEKNGSPAVYRRPRHPSQERRPRRSRRELPNQHHLIAGVDRHFAKVSETEEGYLRPFKRLLVDIYGTRPVVERALGVANTLFLEFEARDCPVKLGPRDEILHVHTVDEREQGERNRHSPYSQPWRPDRPTVVYVPQRSARQAPMRPCRRRLVKPRPNQRARAARPLPVGHPARAHL